MQTFKRLPLWNHTNKQILKHIEIIKKKLIIKFEELVKFTEKNMKKISKFLKIRFQKSMLNQLLMESQSNPIQVLRHQLVLTEK